MCNCALGKRNGVLLSDTALTATELLLGAICGLTMGLVWQLEKWGQKSLVRDNGVAQNWRPELAV